MSQSSPWVTTYLPLASTLVVSAATVVLVWLTGRYVRLTAKTAEESQRSREPSVTIDFELPDHTLRLVVQNHGLSPASNIRIEVLKDITWLRVQKEEHGLSAVGPIQHGVSYLTPSRCLKYFLGYPSWKDVSDDEMTASLRITYESETGGHYDHVVDFDFAQMREVLFESFKDPNLAVAEAIKQAERDRQWHERPHGIQSMFRAPQKQCPMCAEAIPGEAKKCSHCGELLGVGPVGAPSGESNGTPDN